MGEGYEQIYIWERKETTESGDNGEDSESVQSRKQMRAKRKGKGRWRRWRGEKWSFQYSSWSRWACSSRSSSSGGAKPSWNTEEIKNITQVFFSFSVNHNIFLINGDHRDKQCPHCCGCKIVNKNFFEHHKPPKMPLSISESGNLEEKHD